MKYNFISENNIVNLMGGIGILAILVVPFIAVNTNFKLGGSGAGILLIGTYLEFLPYFSQNIWHKLLGVLLLLVIAILAIIYTFIVISAT
ncbi:hypothetical protein [Lactiplantibacillus paraxiangfangensis]|uniref:hypothetical protein n=1 Tax=Lactiplantibacillus paraxiangfangensis TaxID=3076224 RepID=UPI0030C6754A